MKNWLTRPVPIQFSQQIHVPTSTTCRVLRYRYIPVQVVRYTYMYPYCLGRGLHVARGVSHIICVIPWAIHETT